MIWQLLGTAAGGFLSGMILGLAVYLFAGGLWLLYYTWKEWHEKQRP